MSDLQKAIPKYITTRKNIIKLIMFTAIFALVFLNIYKPFKFSSLLDNPNIKTVFNSSLILITSLIILTGIFVLVISRIIMYYRCKNRTLKLQSYILWVFMEIFFMALFYSLFEKFALGQNNERDFLELFKVSLLNTSLVILLPYSVSWLYFAHMDQTSKLELLENEPIQPLQQNNMIPFYDEKNVLRFSLKNDDLLYIESSENYIKINYLNKGEIGQFLLRNTLKKMENKFKDTNIIRAHRSYMVNFDKVKIIRKEKDGLKLDLESPISLKLPVSKTYVENIMNKFTSTLPSQQ